MAEAAKAARGSFTDIKSGAHEMGTATKMSMTDAREGVMLLGEQFGVHLPRALTTFVAELGPVAGAIEAAFPFLAVAALAGILIEHLEKLREAGIKLTDDQEKFGTAAQNAFNDLDKKLLQAGITADDLSNNHLGAIQKKLQLIDMQSMDELNRTFGILQKAADAVFKDLDSHWYSLGSGSTGAKNALDQFQTKYDSLLASGKNKEASDLLGGTLQSAKQSLAKLESAQTVSDKLLAQANVIQRAAMLPGLKEQEIARKDAITSQRLLVQTLEDQATAQGKVNSVASLEKKNVVHADNNDQSAKRATAAREAAESKQRLAEQGLASERATADAAMTIGRVGLEQRLASDLEFAAKDLAIKQAANQAEIAGLNKAGKDYNQQLKTLQDAALAITAEYNTKVVELKSKATVAENNRDISQMEAAEALKIGIQKEGTAARMTVIDQAIAEEQAKGLENTQHYQELLRQREAEALKEAEAEAKAAAKSADDQAKEISRVAEAKVKESNRSIATQHGDDGGGAKQIAIAKQQSDAAFQIKQQALQKELDAYRQAGAAKLDDAKRVQDEIQQLNQEQAQADQNFNNQQRNAVKQTYADMANTASQSLMQIALGHESLAATVQRFVQQGVESMLEGVIKQMAGDDMAKMSAAKVAAANAMKSVSGIPIVGAALAPVAGAAVFAAAMAFEKGGVVPGVGKGDVVPAMLSPGEGIVPGGVMDGLRDMARNGGFNGGGTTNHYHSHPTYHVSVLDGDGMRAVLEKNADVVHEHFTNSLRKMNQ